MKVLLFFALFLGGVMPLSAQVSRLRGYVYSKEGKPLSLATITLSPSGKKTTSDTKGFYLLTGLKQGSATIKVTSIGYNTYVDTIQLTANTLTKDIRLEPTENMLEGAEVISQKKHFNANAESLVKIENSIMPVTIIDRRTIQLMGSRRLDEVLKEQTGIAIVNDLTSGSRSVGVQMQGFGSEYIMILIDGQPMAGRNGGNFDLSRISVSNIERVEITKGSASNIYGGDALGGTINVITRHDVRDAQGMVSLAYGSNETVDAAIDAESPVLKNKGSIWLSGNYYHTSGFNTDQGAIQGTTAPPYDNYAGQGRFRYQFNPNTLFSTSARYGLRRSFMSKDYGVNYTTEDQLDEKDLNLSANIDHRFNKKWRTMSRYYFTRYSADMSVALKQGDSLGASTFGQTIHRLEQQISYTIPGKLDLISGLGGNIENMDEQALLNADPIKSYFAYTQANWKITPKLEFTLGLRYDNILEYGWRLDPSMALKYKIGPDLVVKAAYGTAFKAPDMKKLYQVFNNPSYNYLLIGSSVLQNVVNQMLASGQVSQYELEPVYGEIKGLALNAEMSKSYNLSVIWELMDHKIRTEASVFYHDITNQINTVLIGRDINGNLIYSYRNNARAYYKGTEMSITFNPVKGLQLSGGYQYLLAKDRNIGKEIKEGGKYYTPLFDPVTGTVNYTPTAADYWGMENRSRHMFNAKVFYTYIPLKLSVNVRVNHRGQYPFSDKNNNGYMDRYDTFVRDHYLLNAGLEKKLMNNRISVRVTAENLLNFVDKKVPSQPGRTFLIGANYQIFK